MNQETIDSLRSDPPQHLASSERLGFDAYLGSSMAESTTPVASASENRSILENAVHNSVSLIVGDRPSIDERGDPTVRSQIEHFAAQAIKTAPLFMPRGRALTLAMGYGGSAVLSGLDETKSNDSPSQKLTEFSLGAISGLAVKASFDFINSREKLNWAVKGVISGMGAQAIETGTSRDALFNEKNEIDLSRSANHVADALLNPTALKVDLAMLVLTHGMAKSMSTAGLSLENSVGSSLAIGTISGAVTGAISEIDIQRKQPTFDIEKVLLHSALQGASSGLGALGGAKIGAFMENTVAPVNVISQTLSRTFSKWSTSLDLLGGKDLGVVFGSIEPAVKAPDAALASPISLELPALKGTTAERSNSIEKSRTPGHAKSIDSSMPLKSFLQNEGLNEYVSGISGTPFARFRAVKLLAPPGDETAGVIQLAPDAKYLPDGGVLKLLINPHGGEFNPEWGKRPFDSKLLIAPKEFEIKGDIRIIGYVQKHGLVKDRWDADDVNTLMKRIDDSGYELIDAGANPSHQIAETDEGLVVIDYSAVGRKSDRDPTLDALVDAEYGATRLDAKSFRDLSHEEEAIENQHIAEKLPLIVDSVAEAAKQTALESGDWHKLDPTLGVAPSYIVDQLALDIKPSELAEELAIMKLAGTTYDYQTMSKLATELVPSIKTVARKAKSNRFL